MIRTVARPVNRRGCGAAVRLAAPPAAARRAAAGRLPERAAGVTRPEPRAAPRPAVRGSARRPAVSRAPVRPVTRLPVRACPGRRAGPWPLGMRRCVIRPLSPRVVTGRRPRTRTLCRVRCPHNTLNATGGPVRARPFERAFSGLAVPRERAGTGVAGGVGELLLDAEQLVVLGDTVRAGRSAGLDLAAADGDGEVGDRGVLGLAGTVAHHRAEAGPVRHVDGVQRLGERADLVDLD